MSHIYSQINAWGIAGWAIAGWAGRVPPGLKEFFNLPFLVLKARHPVPPMHTVYKNIKCKHKLDIMSMKFNNNDWTNGIRQWARIEEHLVSSL